MLQYFTPLFRPSKSFRITYALGKLGLGLQYSNLNTHDYILLLLLIFHPPNGNQVGLGENYMKNLSEIKVC